MKKKNKQKEETPRYDKFRIGIINYIDIIIRGLIAFIFIGVILSIILIGYFGLKPFIVLPIIFLLSVFSSPILSKIKLGEKIITNYEKWLSKNFIR